jgi:hypothetical protein
MDRIRIPRRVLELKLKGKRHMGQPRTRGFSQVLEDIQKRGNNWQEIGKEILWDEKRLEIGDFTFINPYKMKMMLEDFGDKT